MDDNRLDKIEELKHRNERAEGCYGSTEIDGIEIEVYIKETIKRSIAISYYEGASVGHRVLAYVNCVKGDEALTLENLKICEDYIIEYELDEINYANLYNAYSVYHLDITGDLEKGAYYCKLGIYLAEKLDDKIMIMRLKASHGVLQMKLQNYKGALELFESTTKYYELKNDVRSIMYGYNNIGDTHLCMKNYKKALNYLNKAYDLATELNDLVIIEDASFGLSKVYGSQGKYNKAISLLEHTIAIAKRERNLRMEVDANFQLINLYIDMEAYNQGHIKLAQCKYIVDELDNQLVALNYYKLKMKISEHLGDFEAAYFSSVKYQELSLLLQNETCKRMSINMLKDELDNTRERLTTMGKIGRDLTTLRDIDEVLLEVVKRLKKHMDVASIGIGEVQDQVIVYNHFFTSREKLNVHKTSIDNKNSLAAYSINNKRPIMINDLNNEYKLYVSEIDVIKNHERHADIQSVLYAPLIIKDEAIGVFTIQSFKKDAYTTAEFEIFNILTSYITITLANWLQSKTLKELSKLDTLTGLNNRRGFTEGYNRLVLEGISDVNLVGMFMMDLDHFKHINDKNGHLAGDLVLNKVGEVLRSYSGQVNLIGRMGGEEFAILVINKDKDELLTIAENLRKSFEQLEVMYQNKIIKVTTSIGITCSNAKDGFVFEQLYYRADKALYQAKNLGRNRVQIDCDCIYED